MSWATTVGECSGNDECWEIPNQDTQPLIKEGVSNHIELDKAPGISLPNLSHYMLWFLVACGVVTQMAFPMGVNW